MSGVNVCRSCYYDRTPNARCFSCVHNPTHGDHFVVAGRCATCRYDPRQHGICELCVDHDQHALKTPAPTPGVSLER